MPTLAELKNGAVTFILGMENSPHTFDLLTMAEVAKVLHCSKARTWGFFYWSLSLHGFLERKRKRQKAN